LRGDHSAHQTRKVIYAMTSFQYAPGSPADGLPTLTQQLGLDPAVQQTFDFSNPDSPPEPKIASLPVWPGYLGHQRHQGDEIWLEARLYLPHEPVDLRCSGCRADSTIGFIEQDKLLLFVVGHQRGCMHVEDLIQMSEAVS
jgi:hypothetical protein